MGRKTASATTLKPDPRFGSKLAAKFINCIMWGGKKATAMRVFYNALEQIKNPLGKSHHAFEVSWDDYEAAQRVFSERGIPHHAPIDWGDHECLYFLDPDGNLLELIGYRV